MPQEIDMFSQIFTVKSSTSMEMVDITDTVEDLVTRAKIDHGYCSLFNPHTTAGLTVNEGADPAVQRDIISALRQIVPMNMDYRHAEGNSPAHVMATLTGCSLSLLVSDGRLTLGTWQRVFFCEFDGPRTRKVHLRLHALPLP
ncbi:MAG: secondary thiamine-phosphate synthase enzyme YjbQ [Desulfopila sp.]